MGSVAVFVVVAVLLAGCGAALAVAARPDRAPSRLPTSHPAAVGIAVAWFTALTGLGWLAGVAVGWVTASGSLGLVDRFAAHRAPGLTEVLVRLTWLGDLLVVVPVAVFTGLVWRWRRGTWSALVLLVAGYLGSALSYNLVKYLVARSRPPTGLALGTAAGASFPSGHTANATAVYLGVALVLGAGVSRSAASAWAGAGAGALIAVVGLSRVYLGLHWLTDVIAGATLAGLWIVGLGAIVARADESWRGDSNP